MRHAARIAGLVTALLAAALASAGAAQAAGLTLEGSRALGPRLTELDLRTLFVEGTTTVRVLLPDGYRHSARRYPVLYLLHGAADDYSAWTERGDAARITAGLPLVVVMPDSGRGGGYTDWYNGGRRGTPAWERYHIGQLVPFIDRRYRTVAGRRGRAVAGLSMGGGGAMTYAARHPDLFAAAASFSGAVDLNNPAIVAVTGDAPYGPRLTQEVRWRARNSVDLAGNLRGVDLTLRTGNGRPGGRFGGSDPIEVVTHQASVTLHRWLQRLGVAHLWDDYGPGGHIWPYWRRGLERTVPHLVRTFARPPARLERVSFTAVEPRYSVFGWHVSVRRPALEFSTLRRADSHGFSLTGSGTAVVRTPPSERECGTYRVRIADSRGGRIVSRRADRRGRIAVTVRLGAGNRFQQFTPRARRSRFRTASVRIAPRPVRACGPVQADG